MSEIFVTKVVQRTQLAHSQMDVKHFIFIRSQWEDQVAQFDFLLTTNNQCYKAHLDYGEIRAAAQELEQPYNDFFNECKTAFTSHMGLPGFDYELDINNDEQPIFKLYKCQGFETLYLDMKLRKVTNSNQLLDAAVEIAFQRSAKSSVCDKNEEIKVAGIDQKGESFDEIYKYVEENKRQERKMLKKFILLLNNKKSHIEKLEKELETYRASAINDDNNHSDGGDDDDEDFDAPTQVLTLPTTQPSQTSRSRAQRILDDTVIAE